MSSTGFALGEKRASYFVSIHCYLEGITSRYDKQLRLIIFYSYSQVQNKRGGGQNKRGGFKDFEKLINGGVKISGGWGQNIKEERRK